MSASASLLHSRQRAGVQSACALACAQVVSQAPREAVERHAEALLHPLHSALSATQGYVASSAAQALTSLIAAECHAPVTLYRGFAPLLRLRLEHAVAQRQLEAEVAVARHATEQGVAEVRTSPTDRHDVALVGVHALAATSSNHPAPLSSACRC